MRYRFSTFLLSSLVLLLVNVPLASARNWDVSVGGQSSSGGGDGYGGGYDTPMLSFVPASLSINVGDTVTFHNLGGAHNVHADDGSFRCAQGCDDKGGNGAPSDDAWTSVVTFSKAGTVTYRCDNHGSMGMVGNITVNGVAATRTPISAATSGSWYNPQQSGHGFLVQVAPPTLFVAYWFVYTPDGTNQAWVSGAGNYDPTTNTATIEVGQDTGAMFPPNFDATKVTKTDWGSLTFTFTDCDNGTVSWTPKVAGYTAGSMPIAKLIGVDGAACAN